jgi:hypothetical protein
VSEVVRNASAIRLYKLTGKHSASGSLFVKQAGKALAQSKRGNWLARENSLSLLGGMRDMCSTGKRCNPRLMRGESDRDRRVFLMLLEYEIIVSFEGLVMLRGRGGGSR